MLRKTEEHVSEISGQLNVRNEHNANNDESFIVYSTFSDKPLTFAKSSALVDYTVYANLLNLSARRRHCLIGNGHMLVRLQPVFCTQKQPENKKVERVKRYLGTDLQRRLQRRQRAIYRSLHNKWEDNKV